MRRLNVKLIGVSMVSVCSVHLNVDGGFMYSALVSDLARVEFTAF